MIIVLARNYIWCKSESNIVDAPLSKMKPYVELLLTPKPVTKKVTGSRGELTTIILPNGYVTKLTPNDLWLHIYIVHIFTIITKTSLHSRWLINTDSQLTKVYRIRRYYGMHRHK